MSGCHIYSEFPVCNNEPDAKRFSAPPFFLHSSGRTYEHDEDDSEDEGGGQSNLHSTRFCLLITYTQ